MLPFMEHDCNLVVTFPGHPNNLMMPTLVALGLMSSKDMVRWITVPGSLFLLLVEMAVDHFRPRSCVCIVLFCISTIDFQVLPM